jgi:hypothetical protein
MTHTGSTTPIHTKKACVVYDALSPGEPAQAEKFGHSTTILELMGNAVSVAGSVAAAIGVTALVSSAKIRLGKSELNLDRLVPPEAATARNAPQILMLLNHAGG